MMTRASRRTLLVSQLLLLTLATVGATAARAAQPAVGLGMAGSFAILGGQTVTNTGPSVINGDLGVAPGNAITGFPPGLVNGVVHANDATAGKAQADLVTAFNDAAGRTPAVLVRADLGGLFLTAGVYRNASAVKLTGDLTLDGEGNADAVFIIQVGSALTTATGSRVQLIGNAQACNVFWEIGSSASLGTDTTFRGNIFALTSITLNTRANVFGRALARNGAVTLDTNVVNRGDCAPGTTPGGGSTTPGGSGTTGGVPAVGAVIDAVTGLVSGPAASPGSTGPGVQPSTAAPGTPSNGAALLTITPRKLARVVARFGVTRCAQGKYKAGVKGLFIRKVTFLVDGKSVGTVAKAPFDMLIRSEAGVHKLRARVSFTDGTPVRYLGFRWRTCSPAARRVAPRPVFTG
jgi:hypothetical protein